MNLKDMGEFGLIRRLAEGCLIRPQGVVRAIGDDAAAINAVAGELILVTKDLLVEGVHFLRHRIEPWDLGYKSLSVNLSDIAAMGGTPREAFVGLAVPRTWDADALETLYAGMKSLAGEFAVNILGGDTTFSRNDLVISVTVLGSVIEHRMLRRDGARPGQRIFITGPLGESRAGLHMILENIPPGDETLTALMNAHVRPRPQIEEGRFLADFGGIGAAMDVSDGLSSDLRHIAEESGVGMRLRADRIPVSPLLKDFCGRFGLDPLKMALTGGEDYVLLCTVDETAAGALAEAFRRRFGRGLPMIGEITAGQEIEIVASDGSAAPLAPAGWDHFRTV